MAAELGARGVGWFAGWARRGRLWGDGSGAARGARPSWACVIGGGCAVSVVSVRCPEWCPEPMDICTVRAYACLMFIFTGHDARIICTRPVCPTCDGRTLMRLARNRAAELADRAAESEASDDD
jgi:hypothetical protein